MLSGTQGTDPGYDPLAFAVQEAHARGLQLHAWINPFRAGNRSDTTRLAPTHLFKARRDLVRVYGTQLWLDPGEPAVHDHVMRVVADIVQRYDIDGIHAGRLLLSVSRDRCGESRHRVSGYDDVRPERQQPNAGRLAARERGPVRGAHVPRGARPQADDRGRDLAVRDLAAREP
jgi:hypothetical protein